MRRAPLPLAGGVGEGMTSHRADGRPQPLPQAGGDMCRTSTHPPPHRRRARRRDRRRSPRTRRSSCSTASPNRTAPGATRSPSSRATISSSRPTSAASRARPSPRASRITPPTRPVADLIALADHLGIDRFTLVGHDWGGAIAWMAALQHPNRIARLIIVNAPHPFVFQKHAVRRPGAARGEPVHPRLPRHPTSTRA